VKTIACGRVTALKPETDNFFKKRPQARMGQTNN